MNALSNPHSETLDFLSQYLAPSGSIHLVSILPDAFDPEHAPTGRFFGSDALGAAQWVERENTAGKNVYWTCNLVIPGLNKKPTKRDIIGVRVAHVDIDPPRDNPAWDKSAVVADLTLRGSPSVIIDSGNGIQALWWLSETTDVPTIEAINRGLITAFNADAGTWNVDRLLRLPGTINFPDKKKQALGRVPVQSRILVPYTGNAFHPSTLAQRFPAPFVPQSEPLPSGPAEGYTGPEDDDQLINMMLASRGGIGAMFGDKATVADLWNGRVEALAKHFPSGSGDAFDRSSADAALMAHLAFWTGKNPERMDRLFRRSALMREKYEKRETYRADTIRKAVSGCRAIYNVVRESPAPAASTTPPPPAETQDNLPGVTAEFLTIPEQVEFFKGCTYVMTDHRVLTPRGDLLKPEQFKAMYGGHIFMMSASAEGSGSTTKNAFEAFTENRAWRFPKVTRTMFNPRLPFGEIENDAVNTYFPDPTVKAEPGDVTPMIEHVARLLPNGDDAEIFWTFCAALVQNPGVKFQWAVFLQGTEGNGKTILAEMVKYAVGLRYYHKPFAADISNKFNDFMVRKLFIDVQEILLEDRYEVAENIKDWITSSLIEVQPKGGAKVMVENWANWLLTSNHKNAVPITANQRRFAPLFTAQQSAEDVRRDFPDGYFPRLWEWFKGKGHIYLTHYLRTRPLHPEYNPAGNGPSAARAPITTSTQEAIGASMTRAEQEILDAVQSGESGFLNGWISSARLSQMLQNKRVSLSAHRVKTTLDALGYVEIGRASRMIMAEGKRPVLYIRKDLFKPGIGADEYCKAQGYAA